jgi:hypothetical protein
MEKLKAIIEKIVAFFAKLFGKKTEPVQVPVSQAPVTTPKDPPVLTTPVAPAAAAKTLAEVCAERGIPAFHIPGIGQFSTTLPIGYTAEQVVDAWQAQNNTSGPDTRDYGSPGRGTLPAASLAPDDLVYLRDMQGQYVLVKQNGDLWRDVCAGSSRDIDRAIQAADLDRAFRAVVPSQEVRDAVAAAFVAANR